MNSDYHINGTYFDPKIAANGYCGDFVGTPLIDNLENLSYYLLMAWSVYCL